MLRNDDLGLNDLRIIGWPVLAQMVPYTRQHVLWMEKAGEFPQRIKLGTKRVGWNLAEVKAWIQARMDARRPPREIETAGASVVS